MRLFDDSLRDPSLNRGKVLALGLQHTFTMFGATVLVPILTGLDVSVALFMAGIGTWMFHLITQGKAPIFLGSSFAFIVPIQLAMAAYGPAEALGGLVVSGLLYVLFAVLVYFIGAHNIMKLFPPIVTGPIIMVIGLNLAPNAIEMASSNWALAFLAFAIVVTVNVFFKGFAKSLPVLIGLTGSYVVAVVITLATPLKLVDFTPVTQAAWVGLPNFTLAKFNFEAIMMVAPVAIVTVVEHIGDVISVSTIVGRDFVRNPGLHRTMLGDGLATSFSALFGGPANTTYSENTGVLALTRQFNPVIMRIAACFAIVLGVVPKLGGIISSIPSAIIGGISIILFGMIASVGARTLIENKVNLHAARNLIIAATILVLGLGGASIPVHMGQANFEIGGMALAAIIGILLNVILPKEKGEAGSQAG